VGVSPKKSGDPIENGFVWENGRFTLLQGEGRPLDINNRGVVVGYVSTRFDQLAVLWGKIR
jgi:hypothetical protein